MGRGATFKFLHVGGEREHLLFIMEIQLLFKETFKRLSNLGIVHNTLPSLFHLILAACLS